MKKKFYNSFILLFALFAGLSAQQYNAVANQGAVVTAGNARFTVLTPDVIRMEWSEDGKFEDHASLTFVNRNLPVPQYTKGEKDGYLYIKTGGLNLTYKINSGEFNAGNLSIKFAADGIETTWRPGTVNNGNLLGTYRTLDGVDGPSKIEPGILSRDGWTFIDDSERPLFDNSDWPWVMARPSKKLQDWYFFAYGSDYKKMLGDFTKISGKIALPPKFAFGYWWSRYWKYTDQEFIDLINEFKIHDMPLDVLVIDMDWHIVNRPEWFKDGKKLTDQAGQSCGWTGFTWNRSVFPDPQKFLALTDKLNIQTCLNLHPASGIQPHEEIYPEFAKAMGIDPATKKYIPFDITNKKYAETYLDLVLHPMEKMGIDFWWLDWQQWSTTKIAGVNPTFYLNYVHFSDMERENKKRPLLYHRWGGLGNHRYQIGFSGDTHITWKSLAFQPYFTATASNVCYGYWSHDIGGHMDGDNVKNPELYTRWIQWGSFSPILRTHCTKNPDIERRVWAYPLDYYYAMRGAIKQRYALLPYIYTAARESYDTGVSMLRPMYYDHPKDTLAYQMKDQYMFGDEMLVSPVTHEMGKDEKGRENLYAIQKVWLPEGKWIEWYSGSVLDGGKIYNRPFCLDEIPVYVKAGAIIPMQKDVDNTSIDVRDHMILNVFPGASGSAKVYDDEGNNQNFKNGKFTFTKIKSVNNDDKEIEVTVEPVEGDFKGAPKERSYELRFPVSFPPSEVTVNGKSYSYNPDNLEGSWNYDGINFTSIVFTPKFNVNDRVTVDIKFPEEGWEKLSGKKKLFGSLMKLAKTIDGAGWWESIWNEEKSCSDSVVAAAQTAHIISMNPQDAVKIINNFDKKFPSLLNTIEGQIKEDSRAYKDLELLNASLVK